MAHVIVQQADANRLESRRHRVELSEDVDAVLVLVDHSLQPSNLTLDPSQPVLEILLLHRVAVHSVPPSGGYPTRVSYRRRHTITPDRPEGLPGSPPDTPASRSNRW